MEDVVASIFDLMGRTGEPMAEEELISERVDRIFEVNYTYTNVIEIPSFFYKKENVSCYTTHLARYML